MDFNVLKKKIIDQSGLFALFVTIVVGLILVPVWLWNVRQQEKEIINQKVGESIADLEIDESSIDAITNPIDEFEKQVQSTLSSPIKVDDVEVAEDEILIFFTVANETLADLIFPTNKAYVYTTENKDDKFYAKSITTLDDKQFPPQISAGKDREGVLHLQKVLSGQYVLVFPEMLYKDKDQTPFTQELDLEINYEWLPRQ